VEHDDVASRIAALERELATLKQEVADRPAPTASRRDLMKKVAIAGAGAAATAVVLAKPAAANSNSALTIGHAQTAQNITYVLNGPVVGDNIGNPLTTEPTMFWIDNRSSTLPNGNGIRGDGKGPTGSGLWGHSDSNGIGVKADGGIGVVAAGTRAAVQLVPLGPPPAQRTDAHTKGELVSDDNGDLWFCTADGTPGTWFRLTAPPPTIPPIPGGLLTTLAAPVRVYDSRQSDGPLAGGDERIVGLAGPPTTPAVPAGAASALVSVTLDATNGAGFLSVFANGVGWPGNSNANWYTSGQILAVTTVTAVDATAKIMVHAGGPGSTQFVIDVIGYYH
jgi:hypothetical protein